jgi:hypothetical protein
VVFSCFVIVSLVEKPRNAFPRLKQKRINSNLIALYTPSAAFHCYFSPYENPDIHPIHGRFRDVAAVL